MARRSMTTLRAMNVCVLFFASGALLACSAAAPTGDSSANGGDDMSAESTDPCGAAKLGDGGYCAHSLNPKATSQNLYTCVGGKTSKRVACAHGCRVNADGVDDACETSDPCAHAALGDGDYCAASLDASDGSPNLFSCVGNATSKITPCAHGCQIMADGVNDVCATSGSTSGGAGSDAVSRARQWVAVGMTYCGSPNFQTDWECSGLLGYDVYCSRYSNPTWDRYRSDCSGLVSFAWNLPLTSDYPDGRRTSNFAPLMNDASHVINPNDLQPGDALNRNVPDNNDGHIILFAGWVDRASLEAELIQEAYCQQPIEDGNFYLTFNADGTVNVPGEPVDYWPIRKN